jgi:lipid A 3-O-deacylase
MQYLQGKFPGFRFVSFIFLAGFFAVSYPVPMHADNAWEGQIASLTWENDAPAGTDRHYTHGALISYFSSDNTLPHWTESFGRYLPSPGFDVDAQKYGFALGQQIYTPDDLDRRDLIEDDRPYAAWLFGRAALQRRGPGFASSSAMEILALDLGIIGPEALGEEAQNVLHKNGPKGWDNQLDTEIAFALRYVRRHLFETRFGDNWRLHLIPELSAAAGTLDTHFGAGGVVRFGYNVPNEFEVPHGPTQPQFGGYIFSGLEGRWVLRNIFLDGNTFHSSHSVDKELLVGELRVGLGLTLKRVEVIVGHAFLTDEFEAQKTDDSYSFATLLVKF